MPIEIGVVMDPIGAIKVKKDTTLAMLLAAQARGWTVRYIELGDLFMRDGACHARMRRVEVRDDPADWYTLSDECTRPLTDLDVVLMRKDPPFDMEYVFTTYMLERAESAGVLVLNRPQSLRDANEKMYTAWFPQCIPPTIITRSKARLFEFLAEQGDIVVKPLDGMGGTSVFRVATGQANIPVIFETITRLEARYVMAQRFLPAITAGDKRILLIDGEPAIDHALARVPAAGDMRGNLAAGATGVGVDLTERDRWICAQVGPTLREKGLVFVGLDVIGDHLTEINVTSPTCVRELDAIYGCDIAGRFLDAVARHHECRKKK